MFVGEYNWSFCFGFSCGGLAFVCGRYGKAACGLPVVRRETSLPAQRQGGAGLRRVPAGEHLDPGGAAVQGSASPPGAARPHRSSRSGPDARGVPGPAAFAYPYHRPLIQSIRVVAHRVIRVVAHVAAYRAAGMRVHDGAALAVVQAEDRQRDPVRVGEARRPRRRSRLFGDSASVAGGQLPNGPGMGCGVTTGECRAAAAWLLSHCSSYRRYRRSA